MLTKNDHKLIHQVSSRHGRKKTGLSLCEGLRCCEESLRRRPEWIDLIIFSDQVETDEHAQNLKHLCRSLGLRHATIDAASFTTLAATDNPQGILCLFHPPPPSVPANAGRDPFILILDKLGEPGNVGTILRTAWAAGLTEVWLTKGTADPYAPKTIRAGMGAQFAIAFRWLDSLTDAGECLKRRGFQRLWLSVPRGGTSCYSSTFELTGSGLVIGSEAQGVSEDAAGTGLVTIPMPGNAESLNAAQAATVLIMEGVRRNILTGVVKT